MTEQEANDYAVAKELEAELQTKAVTSKQTKGIKQRSLTKCYKNWR
jgi:hypothetical protein